MFESIFGKLNKIPENEEKVMTETTSGKNRKSLTTVELVRAELAKSNDSHSRRRSFNESNRMTYAEFYLRTKRSGSLALPVSQYTQSQLKELKQAFDLLDMDKDNYLNANDLKRIFRALNPRLANDDLVNQFIHSANNDDSGQITQEQFNAFIGGTYFGKFSRMELRYVFDMLDRNGDGFIGHDDMSQLYEELNWHRMYDFNELYNSMDFNRDGRICFEGLSESIYDCSEGFRFVYECFPY